MSYDFNFTFIWNNVDQILWGLVNSLRLAALSIPIAMAFGLLLALIYVDGNRFFRGLVAAYVEVVRNAPLLLWVYIVFYGVPQATGLRYDREVSFVTTLACYGGAYLVEVFRAGLQSVPRGLTDAGYAIGMTSPQVLLHVRLPTMFRIILPSLSNACISLFKDTSIAMVLGIPELAFTAQWINTSTFRVVEAWIVIVPLYLVTTYSIIFILRRFERRFQVA